MCDCINYTGSFKRQPPSPSINLIASKLKLFRNLVVLDFTLL